MLTPIVRQYNQGDNLRGDMRELSFEACLDIFSVYFDILCCLRMHCYHVLLLSLMDPCPWSIGVRMFIFSHTKIWG